LKQALDYSQFVNVQATRRNRASICTQFHPYNLVMHSEFDAVIVGRGLVGVAAARALATEGMRVALVGPKPLPTALSDELDLRVYALSPGSIAMLSELKVWGALDAKRVAAVNTMRVFSPSSAELAFNSKDVATDSLNYVVEHNNLSLALEQALTFSSASFCAEKVVKLEQGKRFASVFLESGQELRAKLIVAADGVDSPIRGFANMLVERKLYDDVALVANLDVEIAHQNEAWQWFCDDGVIAFLPMAGTHQMSLVWSGPPAIAGYSAEKIASELTRISAGALGQVRVGAQTKTFSLQWLRAADIVASRVVLLGDAAHCMHPLAGQGLNLGFGDLASFLQLLRHRLAGQDIGDARFLRQYQRMRAEPVDAMLFITDQLHARFARSALSMPERAVRTAALLGWGQLARSNLIARQIRKQITQHALA
jgi:2-polyprenylphenol 6-hydroxylase